MLSRRLIAAGLRARLPGAGRARVLGTLSLCSRVCARGLVTRSTLSINSSPAKKTLSQPCTPWARCMSIVQSPFPQTEVPRMPLAQYVMRDFDNWPNKTAVYDTAQNRSYTFQEVKQYSRSVGSSLLKMGVKAGDVVCIHSPNSPEFVFAFLGAVGIGAVATLANPAYTSREVLYQLEDSRAKHLITTADLLEPARQAAKNYGRIKNMFVVGGEHVPGCRPFTDLLQDNGDMFPDDLASVYDPDGVVVLPYSSGTTGLPKGVMLSHHNIVSNMTGLKHEKMMHMAPDECLLAFLPFYHAYGLIVKLAYGLHCGAKLVTIPKFEAEPFLRYIEEHKATKLLIVPPVGLLLAKHPMIDQIDFSSVYDIMCAAAPMGSETEDVIRKRLGVAVRQGYGMTELSPAGTILPMSDTHKKGSVGLLMPGTEGKVRDIETDEPLGPGKEGELCLRGDLVMKGYLNNPEATKNCMEEDGWLRTGDIGYYDEEGYFFIVDRLKELIKYKSYQVAPAELEALILSIPGVLDTAVVGKPDEAAGELPVAFVVKKPDADITEDGVIEFIQERVAPTKRLRGGVIMVKEIPKSPSGKILRRVLRDGLKGVDEG